MGEKRHVQDFESFEKLIELKLATN